MLINRGKVIHLARVIYHKLPVSQPTKNRLKELVIQGFRTVFQKPAGATNSPPAAAAQSIPTPVSMPVSTPTGSVNPGARKPVLSVQQLFSDSKIVEGLATHEIALYPNFADYQSKIEARTEKRLIQLTKESDMLPQEDVGFKVDGHCVICKDEREFLVDFQYAYEKDDSGRLTPNWRESLVCPSCVMNNRVRAAADLLINQLGIYAEDRIFTTEQLTSFYGWLSKQYPNVIGSEYLGDDKAKGEVHNNIRHEDITQLSFADNSLDIILSFDVLEHVPDTTSSISEFMRCLKPGGFALISAPFASNDYKTIVRAKMKNDGSIEHLMTPEYHGNPTKPDEGSLCFYHFGWDLVDQLMAGGAKDAGVVSFYSGKKANLGPEQLFFLAVK